MGWFCLWNVASYYEGKVSSKAEKNCLQLLRTASISVWEGCLVSEEV